MPAMSKNIIYQGQSFLDKVLETTGSIESAFAMSLLNGISLTDDIEIGDKLKPGSIINQTVVEKFNEFSRSATAMKRPPQPPGLAAGIGYMLIGVNFKIG